MYAELVCNSLLHCAIREQASYFVDICLCEFRCAAAFATIMRAMNELVGFVFCSGFPKKVHLIYTVPVPA